MTNQTQKMADSDCLPKTQDSANNYIEEVAKPTLSYLAVYYLTPAQRRKQTAAVTLTVLR